MELIIGAVIAVLILLAFSEQERLGEDNERAWVNRLADQSKRVKHGRVHKYSRAGYFGK